MVFCHTSTLIDHRYTCVPCILNLPPPPIQPHPSGLSQSTSFGCLASYIEIALVICFTYGNVYVPETFLYKYLRIKVEFEMR